VIADPRVVTKTYGRGLIQGLPPARRIVGRWADVVEEVRQFYARKGRGARGEGRGGADSVLAPDYTVTGGEPVRS